MNTTTYSVSLAKELDSVRQKKIQDFRKRIASGNYAIQNSALARALVPLAIEKALRSNPHH